MFYNVENKYSMRDEIKNIIVSTIDIDATNGHEVADKILNLFNVNQQSELLKVLGRHIAEQYDLDENEVIEQLEWKSKNL